MMAQAISLGPKVLFERYTQNGNTLAVARSDTSKLVGISARAHGPVVPCERFMRTYRQYADVFDKVGQSLARELQITRTGEDMLGYSLQRPMTEGRCRTSTGAHTGVERLVELSVRAPETNQALFRSHVKVRPHSYIPDLTFAASIEPGVESKVTFEMAPENGAVDEALHRFLIEIQGCFVPDAYAYDDILMSGRIRILFPKPDEQLPHFKKMVWAFSREWLVAFKRQRRTSFRLKRMELFGTRREDDKTFLEEHLGVCEGQRLYSTLWHDSE